MSKTCLKLVPVHDFDYPKHKSRERGVFIRLFISTAYRYKLYILPVIKLISHI